MLGENPYGSWHHSTVVHLYQRDSMYVLPVTFGAVSRTKRARVYHAQGPRVKKTLQTVTLPPTVQMY